jgi:hypothetical protein
MTWPAIRSASCSSKSFTCRTMSFACMTPERGVAASVDDA